MANFPFATIEPNVGVVPVPDERLGKLADVIATPGEPGLTPGVSRPPIVPATVEFVDIAGLIAGASKGEGLGNKFLSHIREVDAICHVVRVFSNPDIIKEGSVSPKDDFEIVKTELDLADLEMTEKHEKKKNAEPEALPLFSKKPILVVLNVDEEDLKNANEIEKKYAIELGLEDQARLAEDGESRRVVAICAKVEAELADLSNEEQKEYLEALGTRQSGLERLIKKAFATLGLITFLTAGEKEVRAWTLRAGTDALRASGTIHTDFMKHFIKADVVDFEDFISNSGWKACRELGKVRSEGRDYIMQDGDVIEFKIGS